MEEHVVNPVRKVFSRIVTPFFTLEEAPGRKEPMQQLFGASIKNQFAQAELNKALWNNDLELLSIVDALSTHTKGKLV